jgi:hypothetical protein
MKVLTIAIIGLFFLGSAQAQFETKNNSISIWGSPEYGADLASAKLAATYRDGFFHSAGFYYRHDFNRWYIRPGICYTQMMLTNHVIKESAYTVKIHRMGFSFSGGYYVLNQSKFRIGLGCGVQALYNIAGITWQGSFREDSVVHLNRTDMFSFGLEFDAHAIFIYRVHNNWEIYGSPFVEMNAIPVVRPAMDITIRAGASFGVGYLF